MRFRTAVITAATLACSGCGSVTEPSTRLPVSTPPAIPATPPATPATPPAPPFVTTGSAAWTLELTSFKVRLFRREPGGPLQYEPETLALKEIGGRSSAILLSLDVDVAGGNRDRVCTDAQMVAGEIIRAGATRDLVVTMGYCMPYAVTTAEVTEVSFTATFADDGGKVGQVRGTANVTGCTLGGRPGLISCK